jgi:spermidine/putrescine transport system permease protein
MKRALSFYVFLVFTFLYVPVLVLILFSFNKDKISSSWSGFTMNWYELLYHNDELISSLKMSFSIAVLSAVIASIIGALTAYALYKYSFKGKEAMRALLNFPVVTPDIVLGIGLLLLFSLLHLTLGYYSILLAHITFNISYCTLIVSTRFSHIDSNLEDAAADLGAKPFAAFISIIVPAIAPGKITSFLVSFTCCCYYFILGFFTWGIGEATLPVHVYTMIKKGVDPQINAISTTTLLISTVAVCFALRVQKESKLLSTSKL